MSSRLGILDFFFSVAGAVLLSTTACVAVKNLAVGYFSAPAAWFLGVCSAVFPAYFLNKSLTDAYRRRCTDDGEASELGSIFGAMAAVSFSILFMMWMGCMGDGGTLAVNRTLGFDRQMPSEQRGGVVSLGRSLEPYVVRAKAPLRGPRALSVASPELATGELPAASQGMVPSSPGISPRNLRAAGNPAVGLSPATPPAAAAPAAAPSRPRGGALAGSDVNGSGIKCFGGGSVTIIN